MQTKNNFYLCKPQNKAGALAQLVEQWTENPCVPGSIPGGTTSLKASLNGEAFFLFVYYEVFQLTM